MARRRAAAAAAELEMPVYPGPVPRLAGIIGHEATTRLLVRLLVAGQLPHAVLFDGPQGCGRRTLALALARALLCQQAVDGDACGSCASCRLVDDGNHPDLLVLRDDRQQVLISTDEIGDLIVDKAWKTPLIGQRQAFVLPAIDRMTPQAANRLLKILEEPPPATFLILTCNDIERLLPTIRSRSQRYHLHALEVAAATQVLEARGWGPRARRAAAAAGGDLRRAQEQDDGHEPPVAELAQLLLAGLHPQRVAKLYADLTAHTPSEGLGTQLQRERKRLQHWLNALLDHERTGLRGADPERCLERLQRIDQCRRDLYLNLHPRLVIEVLAMSESSR